MHEVRDGESIQDAVNGAQTGDAILYSGNDITIEWFKIEDYKGNAIMGQAGNSFVIRYNFVVMAAGDVRIEGNIITGNNTAAGAFARRIAAGDCTVSFAGKTVIVTKM